jgi:hypothetical protein
MYVDLHNFGGNLAAATDARTIKQACVDLERAIEGKGASAQTRDVRCGKPYWGEM